MIFGKSYDKRKAERQREAIILLEQIEWKRKFSWLPRKLESGEWVFLEWVEHRILIHGEDMERYVEFGSVSIYECFTEQYRAIQKI